MPLTQSSQFAVLGVPVHVPGRHSLHDVAPAPLKLPGGQDMHVADEFAAVVLEYFPATQRVHVDAPEPLNVPAEHAYCVGDGLPAEQ